MQPLHRKFTLAIFQEEHDSTVVWGAHCMELNAGGSGDSRDEAIADAMDAIATILDELALGTTWNVIHSRPDEISTLDELQQNAEGPIELVQFLIDVNPFLKASDEEIAASKKAKRNYAARAGGGFRLVKNAEGRLWSLRVADGRRAYARPLTDVPKLSAADFLTA